MDARDISILFSEFGLIKAIYCDIEHCFSRIDMFLHNVVMDLFLHSGLSTLWDNLGAKTKPSNSFEAHCQRPVHNKRSDEHRKLNMEDINLVMTRLGVGSTMEDTGEHFDEDGLLSLFNEEEPGFDEIKVAFEVFDWNKDGYIDCSDLRRVLCGLGFEEGCDLEDCKRMIRRFDADGDDLIDFREFVIFMEKMLFSYGATN